MKEGKRNLTWKKQLAFQEKILTPSVELKSFQLKILGGRVKFVGIPEFIMSKFEEKKWVSRRGRD